MTYFGAFMDACVLILLAIALALVVMWKEADLDQKDCATAPNGVIICIER